MSAFAAVRKGTPVPAEKLLAEMREFCAKCPEGYEAVMSTDWNGVRLEYRRKASEAAE